MVTITNILAAIGIGLNIVTLYPNPSGIFFFNFKDLISTLLNVDNFTDDLNPDIETTLVYDWTNKISLTDDVVTTIELSNDTTETDTISITWLSAFVQLRNWKRTYPANDLLTTDIALLQKKNENDYFNYHFLEELAFLRASIS